MVCCKSYLCGLLKLLKSPFVASKSIKYRYFYNNFQEKLKLGISKIKSSSNIFIFADKTNTTYEMKTKEHEKLIIGKTKMYQRASGTSEKAINMETKNIAKTYKLVERIDHLPRPETLRTLLIQLRTNLRKFATNSIGN